MGIFIFPQYPTGQLQVVKMITKCPFCGRVYETDLKKPLGDNRLIQDIFPNATAIQREQLITGICSDECWDKYVGRD